MSREAWSLRDFRLKKNVVCEQLSLTIRQFSVTFRGGSGYLRLKRNVTESSATRITF